VSTRRQSGFMRFAFKQRFSHTLSLRSIRAWSKHPHPKDPDRPGSSHVEVSGRVDCRNPFHRSRFGGQKGRRAREIGLTWCDSIAWWWKVKSGTKPRSIGHFVFSLLYSVSWNINHIFCEGWHARRLSNHPPCWIIVCLVLEWINEGDPLAEVLLNGLSDSGWIADLKKKKGTSIID